MAAKVMQLTTVFVMCLMLFSDAKIMKKNDYNQGKKIQHTDTDIKKVHIVFMNHLDVGYANFFNVILNEYFTEYFDRAISLANQLREGGYVESFIYTTHPWLVSLYLDCPPFLKLSNFTLKCPNATQIQNFSAAVLRGDITWHAGPMNMQIENMDESLLEYGLNLSQDLDKRFNITRKFRTLSQRDVPGMTHSIIPGLVQNGIVGVAVGVNPSTAPPAVPSLFRWWYGGSSVMSTYHPGMTQAVIPGLVKHGVSAVSVGVNGGTAPPALPDLFRWWYNGESVLATWHPGGYPNNPGPNPDNPGGLSKEDCAMLDGFTEALCFAFRTDNSGPPESLQELLGYYEILRKEFPGAQLVASTLENYMAALSPYRNKLPNITNEVGDTWIQGIASDPRKMAEFRAIRRVLGNCIKAGECLYSDTRIYNASRFLVKIPEHTMGLNDVRDTVNWSNSEFSKAKQGQCLYNDTRVYNASRFLIKPAEHTWGLPTVSDTINWSNEAFNKVKQGGNFRNCTLSWQEQREMNYLTVSTLKDHPVVPQIMKELGSIKPAEPDLTDFMEIPVVPSTVYTCGNIKIGFSMSGAINNLQYNKVSWASEAHPLSQFMYISYNQTDIDNFGKLYNYGGSAGPGYNKNNVTVNAHPESRNWPVSVDSLYQNTKNKCDFYSHMKTDDSRPRKYYGAPADIWIRYTVRTSGTPGVDISVQWFDKTSTRLPESLMLHFAPSPLPNYRYMLSKLGHLVDPLSVILNGSQYQHAVDDGGFYYTDLSSSSGMQVKTFDVPLACIATTDVSASPYPAPLSPIKANVTGISYNFYNNIWDTNYIFWYPYLPEDAHFKARFAINFVSKL